MSELFKQFLKELFTGNVFNLMSQLKTISTKEREQLYKKIKPIMEILWEAKKLKHNKTYTFTQFYEFIKEDPEDFINSKWSEIKQKGSLYYPEGHFAFYCRYKILQIGVYPKKEMKAVFKLDTFRADRNMPEYNLVLLAGKTLIDRNEEWTKNFLLDMFKNYEKWFSYGHTGISDLLLFIRMNYSDWKNDFNEHIGKVMYKEGFHSWDGTKCHFQNIYDSEMIVIGLDFDKIPSDVPISYLPVANETIKNAIVSSLVNKEQKDLKPGEGISRKALIDLIFIKLITHMKESVSVFWIDFLERVKLTDEEKVSYKERYIDMIGSSNTKVLKFALDEIDFFLKNKSLKNNEIFEAIGRAILSPVKQIAEKALFYLKRFAKEEKELLPEILSCATEGLISNNKSFRQDIIKWLKTLPVDSFTMEHKEKLSEFLDFLSSTEKSEIKSLKISEELKTTETKSTNTAIDLNSKINELKEIINSKKYNCPEKIWLNFLEIYQKENRLTEVEPFIPDYVVYHEDNIFCLAETPEKLAEEFLYHKSRQNYIVSEETYETIYSSVLKFKKEGNSEQIIKFMDPLNRLLPLFNIKVNLFKDSYPKEFSHDVAILGLISYAWQNEGKPFDFRKEGSAQSSFPLGSAYQNLMPDRKFNYSCFIQYMQTDGIYEFLSTPTHESGWISLEVFAKRYINFPENTIDIWDLTKALYRLPLVKSEHENAWKIIENKISGLKNDFEKAVALAIAPENTFKTVLDYYIKLFENNPPLVFITGFQRNPKTGYAEETEIFDNHTKLFHLVYSALRARFGLEDLRKTVPEFCSDKISKNFTAISNRGGQKFENLRENYISLFWHPESLERDKYVSSEQKTYFPIRKNWSYKEFPQGEGACYDIWGEWTAFPHINAYLGRSSIIDFPPVAQRAFEYTVRTLYRDMSRTDGYVHKAFQVNRNFVDVSKNIFDIVFPLKFQEHRQKAVEIIYNGLKDGRITPKMISDGFISRFKANDNSQYIDYLLQELMNYDFGMKLVCNFVIEKVISSCFENLNPKTASIVLERYLNILEDLKRIPANPEVIKILENLAKGKKSVSQEKAKQLLNLKGDISVLPLEVEIISNFI